MAPSVGATSNIYVSVTGPQSEKEQHDGYRRQRHIWLISVEPHHTYTSQVPGMGNKDHEPLHYAASKDPETGVYTLKSFEVADGPSIIGNILIVENGHVSTDKLREVLEEELGSRSSASQSKDSDDEPESWIRRAIHSLQHRKIADSFAIEEFMMFAHGYLANRLEGETPALIAYPKLHKDHEKKSSKHKFWISHPTAQRRTRVNSNGEALTYGGLM